MKQIFKFILPLLICLVCLIGCGKDFSFSSTNANKIAMRQSGIELTLVQPQEVARLIDAMSTGQPVETALNTDNLEAPLYTFTLYNDDIPKETIQVYNTSLLLINNTFFKGDFEALFSVLESHFYVTNLQTFNEIFSQRSADIAEVHLQDHTSKTYKVVTDSFKINELMQNFTKVSLCETVDTGDLTKQFTLRFRLKNEANYNHYFNVYLSETNQLQVFTTESKAIRTNHPFDMATFYNQLSNNPMPLS